MAVNNKRIAKNAFYLYLRMLMVMVVSLYTVRVVLNTLGSVDYGINNVVGGFVAMFVFLSSILTSASLRFFAYSIGKNDQESLNKYFTMSFWCFSIVSLIVLAIAETACLWFVVNKLNIPSERMDAALWVYHFSILTFIVNIQAVPFASIVIAREQMNMYAVIGIIECVLKLAVAFLITVIPYDNLKVYAVLMFLMTLLVNSYYLRYGLKHFEECRIRCFWDKKMFMEIVCFSGWTMFGAISGVLRSQGINILLNMFFNPIVNAARAIAFQVNTSINQFVVNFYKAVQPQITKSYGAGQVEEMNTLVLRSSRFCYYLVFVLSLPVILETEYLLTAWLEKIPENTVLFTRLVVITAIVDSISYPIQSSITATGRIKYFQLVTGGLLLLNLPVSWVFLSFDYPPEITMYIAIALSVLAQASRILFAYKYTGMSMVRYAKDVLTTIIFVTAIASVLPVLLQRSMDDGFVRFIIVSVVSVASCVVTVYTIGMNEMERSYITSLISQRIHGFTNHK